MQKIIAIILCGIILSGFHSGTICGHDGDVICVDICGNEYSFFGDGFAEGESVTVYMIGEKVEGVWKND